MPSFRPSLRLSLAAGLCGAPPLLMGADGISLAPLIVSGLSSLAVYLATIAFRVRAARKRARAAFEKERAAAQLADGDPTNDQNARELLLAAAEDEAEAKVLDDLADRRGPRL